MSAYPGRPGSSSAPRTSHEAGLGDDGQERGAAGGTVIPPVWPETAGTVRPLGWPGGSRDCRCGCRGSSCCDRPRERSAPRCSTNRPGSPGSSPKASSPGAARPASGHPRPPQRTCVAMLRPAHQAVGDPVSILLRKGPPVKIPSQECHPTTPSPGPMGIQADRAREDNKAQKGNALSHWNQTGDLRTQLQGQARTEQVLWTGERRGPRPRGEGSRGPEGKDCSTMPRYSSTPLLPFCREEVT